MAARVLLKVTSAIKLIQRHRKIKCPISNKHKARIVNQINLDSDEYHAMTKRLLCLITVYVSHFQCVQVYYIRCRRPTRSSAPLSSILVWIQFNSFQFNWSKSVNERQSHSSSDSVARVIKARRTKSAMRRFQCITNVYQLIAVHQFSVCFRVFCSLVKP